QVGRRPRDSRHQRVAPDRACDRRGPRAGRPAPAGDRSGDQPRDGRSGPGSRWMTDESVVEIEELAQAADGFALSLADLVAGEPELRYQGMPSDGDSRAVYAALGAEG